MSKLYPKDYQDKFTSQANKLAEEQYDKIYESWTKIKLDIITANMRMWLVHNNLLLSTDYQRIWHLSLIYFKNQDDAIYFKLKFNL